MKVANTATDMPHYTHGTSNIWLAAPLKDSAPRSSHRQLNVNHTPSSTFQARYCYSTTEVLSLSNPGLPNVSFNHYNTNSHHSTFQAMSSLNVRRPSTNQTSAFYPDSKCISVCLVRSTVLMVSGDYIPNINDSMSFGWRI
jgi:hypothetical protein